LQKKPKYIQMDQLSPPRSSSKTATLQYTSPQLSRTVLFASPESTTKRISSNSARLSSRARTPSASSSFLVQTPASSFSSKINRAQQGSPTPDSSSTISSGSRISRLFADYEKQKELDDARFNIRVRELEDEKNRVMGENESLLLELDRAKQDEGKAKKEIEDLKEKIFQLRKDADMRKREEEARRRLLAAEIDELKKSNKAFETDKQVAENELQQTQRAVQQLEAELENEKQKIMYKVEAASKRAVEKERIIWEKEESLKRQSLEEELDQARKSQQQHEINERTLRAELEDLRKSADRMKAEFDREKLLLKNQILNKESTYQSETDMLKKRCSSLESARKRQERELEETKAVQDALTDEIKAEKERLQQVVELSCHRAVEKDREERGLLEEARERELERIRKEMENELETSRTRIGELQHALTKSAKKNEDTKKYAEAVQVELENERERAQHRIELACKLAVEKEKNCWEKHAEQKLESVSQDLNEAKLKLSHAESETKKLQEDLDEVKHSFEKYRVENENERSRRDAEIESKDRESETRRRTLQNEVELLKRKLLQSEATRKKGEQDLQDLRKTFETMEAEAEMERQRIQQRIELACRRAVEKDQLEKKSQLDSCSYEEEKKRKMLEKELEELRAKLFSCETKEIKLEKEIEQQQDIITRLRTDVEREREKAKENIDTVNKKAEKDRRNYLLEKQALEGHIQELEHVRGRWLKDKDSFLEIQEQNQLEISELQTQLNEAAAREERLLLDMADLRTRTNSRIPIQQSRPQTRIEAPTSSRLGIPKISLLQSRLVPTVISASSSSTNPYSPQRHPFTFSSSNRRGVEKEAQGLSRRVANAKRLLESDWN
jgi:hypothetical protein